MKTEKPRPEKEKKTYAKPVLRKHGNLKEITGLLQRIGSSGQQSVLGCTRW